MHDGNRTVDDLHRVVRRNACRHADGDTGRAVDQKVRKHGRQNGRFLLVLIKVRDKFDESLIQVIEHRHGAFRESGLGITHGSSAVAVDGTEVTVAVDERNGERVVLGHMHERFVNRRVTVRMVFTHGSADDTGTLTVRLLRIKSELLHGIKNAPLNRLQAVPHIRNGTGDDDAHCIVTEGGFHFFRKIQLDYGFFLGIQNLLPPVR